MATWQLAPETPEQALTRGFMESLADKQAEIDRLRAELAAVPVDALRRQYKNNFPFEGDIDAIIAWLDDSLEATS